MSICNMLDPYPFTPGACTLTLSVTHVKWCPAGRGLRERTSEERYMRGIMVRCSWLPAYANLQNSMSGMR